MLTCKDLEEWMWRLLSSILPICVCSLLLALVQSAPAGIELACCGPYVNHTVTHKEMKYILEEHSRWLHNRERHTPPESEQSEYKLAEPIWLRRTNLCKATYSGGILSHVDLTDSSFEGAKLTGVNILDSNLSGANLRRSLLDRANVRGSRLSGATLDGANLHLADLTDADMTGASLRETDMTRVIFEPKPGALPNIPKAATAKGLSTLRYLNSPHAMVELREAFKRAGLREQEREITYALKREEASRANAIERGFNFLLFDLTSGYAMYPGRPLRILIFMIFVFALPYMIAIYRKKGGGIWIIWSKESLPKNESETEATRVTGRGLRLVLTAFYFSLLTAFHIGWPEINVGNWIARLQAHEYTHRATGWVRSISGIQSLISVYLVALWVLTYFGRPFE